MRLLLGDSSVKLKELEDNSVDSIVTDPPYGLSFMGKKWDYDVPSQEIFEECLRVLKPGGHLLSFAGSRTYHRMAVRVEDAGFEIRDQIMWIYGSGFPKSLNIGKAVDKQGGNSLGKEVAKLVKKKRLEMGLSTIKLAELGKFYGNKNHGGTVSNWETGRGSITPDQFNKLIEILKLEDNAIIETKREVLGKLSTNLGVMQNIGGDYTPGEVEVTKGNSEWEGWGTALKPAHEPIVMARKPLSEKTIVDNVLEWGTGGINVEESRIPYKSKDDMEIRKNTHRETNKLGDGNFGGGKYSQPVEGGRFPANIIFDEDAGKILDKQSGITTSGKVKEAKESYEGESNTGFIRGVSNSSNQHGGTGGASRFFYCPKTSKTDRNEGLDDFEDKLTQGMRANAGPALVGNDESGRTTTKNNHPTVKPTDLMLYLIRLVTPKGGTTLDPFMGSGSTGKAAVRGGFDFIGVEMDKDYMEIAETRIQYEKDNPYNEEKKERVKINKNSHKFF